MNVIKEVKLLDGKCHNHKCGAKEDCSLYYQDATEDSATLMGMEYVIDRCNLFIAKELELDDDFPRTGVQHDS